MPTPPTTIKIHRDDNVLIALRDLRLGETLTADRIVPREPIARGHKIARCEIAAGDAVIKFGHSIGLATRAISAGEHVHSHNLAVSPKRDCPPPPPMPAPRTQAVRVRGAEFAGFIRTDGRVGTRNYIGILTSVNCAAHVARLIAEHFTAARLAPYANVDGVVAFTHHSGCGMAAQNNEGLAILQRTLAGYARHPNFSHVLMIGLGCEVNQIPNLLDDAALDQADHIDWMTIQEQGGTRHSVAQGIEKIQRWLPQADRCRRQAVAARHLKLGLQCGGSDAYSGITANPSLGHAVDLLVQQGGTAILSETPEICGAENLLLDRAVSTEVTQALLRRLQWWQAYTERHGVELDNNPSPGNKQGGLTTIFEKSLGAVAKSGTSPLVGVFEYAQTIDIPGLVFMDAPGYDPCSVTGEIASGANLLCFTTGRGSVFGAKPAPSIKLATTSELFDKMRDDMDINCGKVLDGAANTAAMGEEIFQALLAVASGEKTASEKLGLGDTEFVPWQLGAVL